MSTGERRLRFDVILGCGIAILLAVTTLWIPGMPAVIRVVLGFLVGLILPGYFLINLVFPRQSDLAGVERWGLILVMNVVLVILLSLVISLANERVSAIRLNASTVAVLLAFVTLLFAAGSVWRRARLSPLETYILAPPRGRAPLFVAGLAMVLAVTTWAFVRENIARQTVAFSVTARNGQLSGYPFEVPVGSRYELRLQVDNPTESNVSYRLMVADTLGTVSNQAVHAAAHGRWTSPLSLPTHGPPRAEAVHFNLIQGKHVVRKLWIRYQIVP